MQFTDVIFLFIYLPIALILFYIAGDWIKSYILLLLSLFFYTLGEPDFILLLCMYTVINSGIAMLIGRLARKKTRKLLLVAGIIMNIALLVFYKYNDNVILPLGLSFYTFKAISVLVDSYKGTVIINSFVNVANYLLFFGQIQSGPISRFEERSNCWNWEWIKLFTSGVERFLVGFSKKILLANMLVKITDEVFAYESPAIPFAWLGAICYSLQLYYDFSGYSDMAIGISNMFGISCRENFKYPYSTASISEFWRRWHISLGEWFRDYVYIPLGGSKVKLWRTILNLGIVWFLTGIWHGDTGGFMLWGFSYFLLILFEKLTGCPDKFKYTISRILYRVFSLLMINFLWIVFYFGHTTASLKFIKRMFVSSGYDISIERAKFLLIDYKLFIISAILFATPIVPTIMKCCEKRRGTEIIFNITYGLVVVGLFVVTLAAVVSGEFSPFLYIGF